MGPIRAQASSMPASHRNDLGAANKGKPLTLQVRHQVDRMHGPKAAGRNQGKGTTAWEVAWVGVHNIQLHTLQYSDNFHIN